MTYTVSSGTLNPTIPYHTDGVARGGKGKGGRQGRGKGREGGRGRDRGGSMSMRQEEAIVSSCFFCKLVSLQGLTRSLQKTEDILIQNP